MKFADINKNNVQNTVFKIYIPFPQTVNSVTKCFVFFRFLPFFNDPTFTLSYSYSLCTFPLLDILGRTRKNALYCSGAYSKGSKAGWWECMVATALTSPGKNILNHSSTTRSSTLTILIPPGHLLLPFWYHLVLYSYHSGPTRSSIPLPF